MKSQTLLSILLPLLFLAVCGTKPKNLIYSGMANDCGSDLQFRLSGLKDKDFTPESKIGSLSPCGNPL